MYTIDLASPGDTAPADLAPATAPANYARLAAPPILYTYYAPSINPATPNPTTLNQWPLNVTHHLHGTPLYWQSAAHGHMHFCGGENGNLRAWSVNADKSSAYLGCSSAYASPDSVASPNPNGPHGGMPGWSIALSASGNTNGVVWGMIPYGDANMELTNWPAARLRRGQPCSLLRRLGRDRTAVGQPGLELGFSPSQVQPANRRGRQSDRAHVRRPSACARARLKRDPTSRSDRTDRVWQGRGSRG